MKFFLERKAKTLIYLLLFISPMLVTGFTNESYEFPKYAFLICVGGIFASVFWFSVITQGVQYSFKPILPVLVYFALFIVSTMLSGHIYTSVFGYFSRFNGGLATLIIFIPIFLYFYLNGTGRLLNRVLLFSSFAPILVGLFQVFENSITRIYSTFGQPNWLAMYLLMMMALALYELLKTADKKEKVTYVFYLASAYLVFWETFSISGYLGLFGAIIFLFVVNQKLLKPNIKYLLIVGVLWGVISIVNGGYFYGRLLDVLKDAGSKISEATTVYAQETNYNYSDTGFIRFGIWEGAYKLATSNPKIFLIGTGPETFPYYFQLFRPASLNYSSEWEYILNKPHNYYLEIFAEQGILSAVMYIYILFIVLKTRHPYSPMLFGYAIANFFGWPSIYNELVFWILIGVVLHNNTQHEKI